MELELIRMQIDEIDARIVELLDKRFSEVEQVAEFKKQNSIETFQPKREQELFTKVRNLSRHPDVADAVFRTILGESKRFQEALK